MRRHRPLCAPGQKICRIEIQILTRSEAAAGYRDMARSHGDTQRPPSVGPLNQSPALSACAVRARINQPFEICDLHAAAVSAKTKKLLLGLAIATKATLDYTVRRPNVAR